MPEVEDSQTFRDAFIQRLPVRPVTARLGFLFPQKLMYFFYLKTDFTLCYGEKDPYGWKVHPNPA